ncbi:MULTISPECIES: TRAP transporter substrate-binding protein DctP [Neorhizobium]|uniref:TRAP transporter substrate-binding protein DctP n=1 Tax=Neorhizobium TaxID=1525371 RepID=UPI00155DFCA8|nr:MULTISPECIES: TRAP transporter substrate-binding protein DctP [Neorhizobium]
MKSTLAGLLAAIALFATAQTATSQELRVLSSWDDSYPVVGRVLDAYTKEVAKASDGKLTFTRVGPETVPPFEQFEAVENGALDILFTNGAYHSNISGLGLTLDGMSGGTDAIRQSGLWTYIDTEYQKIGIKVLALFIDPNGYQFILKKPLGPNAFAGLRLRGSPVYHPSIKALGGSPVVLPGGEIFSALEKGVIDGAGWTTIGVAANNWFNVAKYIQRPTFGQSGYLLLMSLDKWRGLDPERQKLLSEVAAKYEKSAVQQFTDLSNQDHQRLLKEGMTITELTPDAQQKLKAAWFTGVMDLGAQKSPEQVKFIRETAVAKGLAH